MLRSLSALVAALRRVFANPDIRRAEAAWMLGYTAEWSWLVALFVFAFGVGGIPAVGLVGVARTLPAGLLAPVLSSLTDELPRRRVLLAVHGGRAAFIGVAALSVLSGWPAWVVLAVAPFDGLLAVLHRPTYMALMPSLARAPEELVASNAASGTMEGIGTLVGPALGGALIAWGAVPVTFAVPAAVFGVAAIAVSGIRPAQALQPARGEGHWSGLLRGIRALRDQPHAALILGLFGAQIFVRGLLNVLLVATSVELLLLGKEGVGFLNAAMGAGGFIGALAAMTLAGRTRLAPSFSLGLVLWGSPILLIGLVPTAFVAVAVLAVLGAGNAVLDVAGFTLLQRIVPNAVRGRVFGVLEAIVMLGLSIGSALAPVLVAVLGLRGALVATGTLLPLLAVITWPIVRRTDALAVIPAREMDLLRRVPMFRLLPLTVLEQVAGAATEERFVAGTRLIGQGETGDRFYVLAGGEAQTDVDGEVVRALRPGDSFGEIALLRDVPRTATVTAATDVSAFVIDRQAFVCAVSGDRQSMAAADQVIGERLATG
ncbi:MAG TPA: MFS transporter [Candidatus Limnocylindria bacterium]|nr:MFS transporter [Candidatus Limnocylindria bacterium]